MDRAKIIELQQQLIEQGLLPRGSGDGVWGPLTAAAYNVYVQRQYGGDALAKAAPPAAKPWWQSKALLGALGTIVVGLAGLAGWEVDGDQIAELLVGLGALVSGILAFVGTVRRKAPIDPDLVLPGVRRAGLKLRDRPGATDDDQPTGYSIASACRLTDLVTVAAAATVAEDTQQLLNEYLRRAVKEDGPLTFPDQLSALAYVALEVVRLAAQQPTGEDLDAQWYVLDTIRRLQEMSQEAVGVVSYSQDPNARGYDHAVSRVDRNLTAGEHG